ncbi:nucleoporin 88-like [Corythoichthys intestinalis]|uniref:nucleoporin 88-like n=1 Tax=Corythoichthys intestinalis TaxID=161448 RepID=UPI0025A4EECF|nr:nucleoporin 88-like [Corythoichthys intestinalis]
MAAFGTDRWLNGLANHDMFKKVRDKLDSEPKTSERAVAKNLIFCLGGDFFLWDDVDRVFYTTSLRQLNTAEDQGESFQTLLCINPPRFPVCQLLPSPTQSHVALVGQRGVSVLELPQRWGKKSEFEGGRSCVNCKTTPVAERFFTSSPSVSLRQAAWYPSETGEPLLVLLTSDNTIRFYGLKAPQAPVKVVPVSQADDDSGVRAPARSYAASLGEVAVAFDFGPVVYVRERPVYPLYILYETGETYLCHTCQVNTVSVGKRVGPLPMYPAAEDNYGYDACAVLCLPCVPTILVIATATGTLYHCVVLESDDDEDVDAEPRCLTGSVPALYVFECVELELTLKVAAAGDEAEDEPDSACPLRLHRDPLCPQRYHCTHEAGVHSVGLAWANKLSAFLRAGEDDQDGLPEAPAERRCAVEHIVCTRPLASSKPAPVRGFLVLSDLSLGATMICVSATYECILLPLLCSVRAPSPPLLCSRSNPGSGSSPLLGLAGSSFEQHVRNILARGATNPLLLKAGDGEPSPQERLQLLSRATQVFREEYILKQDMAREELQKRVKLLRGQRAKQLEELARFHEERAALRREAERLADKYEDAKYRQDAASQRVKRALAAQRLRLPVLSNSEKDMRKELRAVAEQLKHLDICIKQVKMKMEYQKTQVERDPPAAHARASISLSGPQKKVVREVLREEGQQIVDMMKQVKEMSRLIAMRSSDLDLSSK